MLSLELPSQQEENLRPQNLRPPPRKQSQVGGENPGLSYVTSFDACTPGPLEVDCVVATEDKQAEEPRAEPGKPARKVACVSPGS